MSLPAELYYYYSASCSETAIKDKLLTVISDIVHPLYTSICSNEIACSVEDVSVKCGHTAKRKKRDFTLDADSRYEDLNLAARRMKREKTYFTVVEFDIITEWTADNMTVDEAFDFIDDLQLKQKTVFADLLVNGSLNIDGYTLRNDSFQTGKWGKFKCGSGMILDGVQCGKYLKYQYTLCIIYC